MLGVLILRALDLYFELTKYPSLMFSNSPYVTFLFDLSWLKRKISLQVNASCVKAYAKSDFLAFISEHILLFVHVRKSTRLLFLILAYHSPYTIWRGEEGVSLQRKSSSCLDCASSNITKLCLCTIVHRINAEVTNTHIGLG